MLKKMFYMLSMVSLLAFATGCEEDKTDEAVIDYTSTGDISLGANGNATLKTGFDVETQTTISTGAGITAADQAKVDIVFLFEVGTTSSFFAPSAVETGTIPAWTTKNATSFKELTGYTAAQWDALTSAQKIKEAYTASAAAASTKGSTVAAGKYYAVKTVGNRYGVIKVTAFTASNTGSTTFNLKVANANDAAAATLFNF